MELIPGKEINVLCWCSCMEEQEVSLDWAPWEVMPIFKVSIVNFEKISCEELNCIFCSAGKESLPLQFNYERESHSNDCIYSRCDERSLTLLLIQC